MYIFVENMCVTVVVRSISLGFPHNRYESFISTKFRNITERHFWIKMYHLLKYFGLYSLNGGNISPQLFKPKSSLKFIFQCIVAFLQTGL